MQKDQCAKVRDFFNRVGLSLTFLKQINNK